MSTDLELEAVKASMAEMPKIDELTVRIIDEETASEIVQVATNVHIDKIDSTAGLLKLRLTLNNKNLKTPKKTTPLKKEKAK